LANLDYLFVNQIIKMTSLISRLYYIHKNNILFLFYFKIYIANIIPGINNRIHNPYVL
jgi:hypothetical protein